MISELPLVSLFSCLKECPKFPTEQVVVPSCKSLLRKLTIFLLLLVQIGYFLLGCLIKTDFTPVLISLSRGSLATTLVFCSEHSAFSFFPIYIGREFFNLNIYISVYHLNNNSIFISLLGILVLAFKRSHTAGSAHCWKQHQPNSLISSSKALPSTKQ